MPSLRASRATRSEMQARRNALAEIIAASQPMTVRQVFYQATVRGLVPKTEQGYKAIKDVLAEMRLDGNLPFEWIVDNTRAVQDPGGFASLAAFLETAPYFYRGNFWQAEPIHVSLWLEKDALAGIFEPITRRYRVPLLVSRGYSSLSFVHEAAVALSESGKPCHVLHFGDWDPSGQDAARDIEEKIRRLAVAAITFERVAITRMMAFSGRYPSRPTKSTDSRTPAWQRAENGDSIELDAIPVDELRGLITATLRRFMSEAALAAHEAAEEAERKRLRQRFARLKL